MSERDYSRLPEYLRPISKDTGPLGAVHNALADTLLGIMDSHDALAKRIEAIEAEAKRLNAVILDDVLNTLGDMKEGEVSAESEWPRYVGPPECSVSGAWANGCILIRFDSASSKGVEIFPSKADKEWYGDWTAMENRRIGMGWKDVPRTEAEARIAAAKGGKPRLDDAFPIPATVEQGQPSEGMKAAAEELAESYCEEFIGQGCNRPGTGYKAREAWIAEILFRRIGPELAAKTAEIARLQRVAEQLREGQLIDSLYAEIGRLRPLAEERNSAISRLENLQQQVADLNAKLAEQTKRNNVLNATLRTCNEYNKVQIDGWESKCEKLEAQLSSATAANVEALAMAESFRKAACIESEKRIAEWHEKERGNDPTGA